MFNFRALFFAGSLLVSSFAHANLVNINGTNWLSLDQTAGMSYNNIAAYSGYHLASKADFDTMINNYVDVNDNNFGDVVGTSHANHPTLGWASVRGNINVADFFLTSFFQDFGLTHDFAWSHIIYRYAFGFYGNKTSLRLGGLQAYFYGESGEFYASEYNRYIDDYSRFTSNPSLFSPSVGWFLIQDAPIPAIPEPSIIALMGLGFFGLGLVRRKMKK